MINFTNDSFQKTTSFSSNREDVKRRLNLSFPNKIRQKLGPEKLA